MKSLIAMTVDRYPRTYCIWVFRTYKGSFTGASHDKVGAFEEATEVLLFLDEIGNLSYEGNLVQLLRVLQERRIRRIGSTKGIEVDVRLVSYTNENLKEAIAKGTFREDLYHRINEFYPTNARTWKSVPKIFCSLLISSGPGKPRTGTYVDRFWRCCKWSTSTLFVAKGNLRQLKNIVKRATLLARRIYYCTRFRRRDSPHSQIGPATSSFALHDEEAEKNDNETLQQTGNNKTKKECLWG